MMSMLSIYSLAVLYSLAGWRYGIMSTVPYEQQKLCRQIILLLHGMLV